MPVHRTVHAAPGSIRIFFIGNSLTYVNDVPGILQALADSAGDERLAVASLALPNYALIDPLDRWRREA